ncbi:MAG: inositol monophosphatase [Candidatus Yonathbacteria bacterium]|nr:inositol monophosphatase [Candidatus Yonathbacteria bacterium]
MKPYDFTVALVKEAGELLLKQSKEVFAVTMKNNDPKDIVTAVDIAVNDFLVGALKKEFPSYGIYSEEGSEEPEAVEYMWAIDPIDGSSNFARHIPHFAICVGLLHKGNPILGVVYNPVTRELFSFKKGEGAYLNGERISVSDKTELRDANVLLHAGRKPELWKWGGESYTKLLEHSKKTSNFGGSALDACFVAAGRVEANVYGRLSTMDIASALGVLYEAGGVAVGVDGKPIALSKEPQKVFMANSQKMANELVDLLG